MAGNWKLTISSFLAAASRKRSYDPRQNIYVLFGVVWGLPIPIFSLLLGCYLTGQPASPRSVAAVLSAEPWQYFFLMHPLIFGGIFGTLGTLYSSKEDQVANLLGDLQEKVQELNLANREFKHIDQIKDEFLSNVTHELKTPLVTIQGYSEMLTSGRLGTLSDKQSKALEVMTRNQERLSELISQLLRYGKMEERVSRIFESPFSVHGLLTYLKQNFLPSMEKKEIKFRVLMPEEDLLVIGQEDLIEQAMRNLIGNSRKFTGNGGEIVVSTDGAYLPDKLGLVVSDNGCGISEDALPYIFERFRQGDGSIRRKYGGTGLGLSIVKRILDAHKAPIFVDSKEGEGTRFTILLPVDRSGIPGAPIGDRRPM